MKTLIFISMMFFYANEGANEDKLTHAIKGKWMMQQVHEGEQNVNEAAQP